MHFNLAPLASRRDMAMLGVIHRAALRQGPEAFFRFVQFDASSLRHSRHHRRHFRSLVEFRNSGKKLDIMRRSLLGLVSVYNLLPERIVRSNSVKGFQAELQNIMKQCVSNRGER